MHEPLTNIRNVIALVCERGMPATEIWRALYGAAVLHRAAGNPDSDLPRRHGRACPAIHVFDASNQTRRGCPRQARA
jgi:hypothetical protein